MASARVTGVETDLLVLLTFLFISLMSEYLAVWALPWCYLHCCLHRVLPPSYEHVSVTSLFHFVSITKPHLVFFMVWFHLPFNKCSVLAVILLCSVVSFFSILFSHLYYVVSSYFSPYFSTLTEIDTTWPFRLVLSNIEHQQRICSSPADSSWLLHCLPYFSAMSCRVRLE
jgi:hypothetical protein